MGVLGFSFLIPVNYLHGSSQASPAGRTTEREAGAQGRREPSVTVKQSDCKHLGGLEFSPSVRPSLRSVSAKIPLEVHGEERAYCSGLHCLVLGFNCHLCPGLATALTADIADSSPCATV